MYIGHYGYYPPNPLSHLLLCMLLAAFQSHLPPAHYLQHFGGILCYLHSTCILPMCYIYSTYILCILYIIICIYLYATYEYVLPIYYSYDHIAAWTPPYPPVNNQQGDFYGMYSSIALKLCFSGKTRWQFITNPNGSKRVRVGRPSSQKDLQKSPANRLLRTSAALVKCQSLGVAIFGGDVNNPEIMFNYMFNFFWTTPSCEEQLLTMC